eukprot:Gb_07061 [translate_table: standard]
MTLQFTNYPLLDQAMNHMQSFYYTYQEPSNPPVMLIYTGAATASESNWLSCHLQFRKPCLLESLCVLLFSVLPSTCCGTNARPGRICGNPATAVNFEAHPGKAVEILEAYEGTLEEDYPPDNERYEHSEMLLYKVK